jgi:hypothetical protein
MLFSGIEEAWRLEFLWLQLAARLLSHYDSPVIPPLYLKKSTSSKKTHARASGAERFQ